VNMHFGGLRMGIKALISPPAIHKSPVFEFP
jgi:hypothetical protein